jgi:hypothetical protein
MAREESDREDLLREATALVERVELCPIASNRDQRESPPHLVIGFRHNGALSIFFGAEPVYQFNSMGQLRRAYCDGLLLKAARGRLVSLRRERQTYEVQLVRHDLTDAEQSSFIGQMQERLRDLRDDLQAGRYRVVGQAPPAVDVIGRVRDWLAQHDGLPIADTPRV